MTDFQGVFMALTQSAVTGHGCLTRGAGWEWGWVGKATLSPISINRCNLVEMERTFDIVV